MTGEYLLNVKGVAAKLSLSVSRIYELIREGVLPLPVAIGGSSRWRGADIDAWIVEQASHPRPLDSRRGRKPKVAA